MSSVYRRKTSEASMKWFKAKMRTMKRERRLEEEDETDFDGSNAKPAGLEKQTDAACGNSFPETAYNSTSHQHVLHFVVFFFFFLERSCFKMASFGWPCKKKEKEMLWSGKFLKNENRTFRGKKMQLQAFSSNIRDERRYCTINLLK